MSQRPDRLRGDKESSTNGARREKEAQHPPQPGRRRGGCTRFAEDSSSQAAVSKIVDPTQHQQKMYQPEYFQPQYEQPHQ